MDHGVVRFAAQAVGDPSAGIQQVFVTYTGEDGSPFHLRWRSLDLTRSDIISTDWYGSLDLHGADPTKVRFMVQAVNGVGLVGIDDNQGAYFTPGVTAGQTPASQDKATVTLDGAPTGGSYGDRVTVSATLHKTDGTPLAGRPISFDLGGSTATAATDAHGVATTKLPVSVSPGDYLLTASFEGDAGTRAAASEASSFAVGKRATTLALSQTPATPTAAGMITATLTTTDPTGESQPLRDKSVYLAYVDSSGTVLGGRTLSTGYYGTADFTLADRPTGAARVRAYFGVDDAPLPTGTST